MIQHLVADGRGKGAAGGIPLSTHRYLIIIISWTLLSSSQLNMECPIDARLFTTLARSRLASAAPTPTSACADVPAAKQLDMDRVRHGQLVRASRHVHPFPISRVPPPMGISRSRWPSRGSRDRDKGGL